MISPITVTCPAAIQTKNRRKKKGRIYQSAEWKRKKAAFVKGKVCEWCGEAEEKKLLPHHPYKNTPDSAYEDLYLSECVVLCQKCHFMFERRHKVICPRCLKNYMPADPSINCCWSCHLKEHPEKAVRIEVDRVLRESRKREEKRKRAEKMRALRHPCRHRGTEQKCRKSGTTCNYSWRRARECGGFALRKGETA